MASLDGARRIILLRHAQTDWNAQKRWQGREDIPLNDAGREQARMAASFLACDVTISRIVTSPVSRAEQTARTLHEALSDSGRQVTFSVDDRLVEIDMGAWSGLRYDQVASRDPEGFAAMQSGADIRRGVHGERMSEAVTRVKASIEEIASSTKVNATSVVVTHGAVIRGVVTELVGMPIELSKRTMSSIGNCHWVSLNVTSSGLLNWEIDQWNCAAL